MLKKALKINKIIAVFLIILIIIFLVSLFRNPVPHLATGKSSYFLNGLDLSSMPDYANISFAPANVPPSGNAYIKEISKEDKLIKMRQEAPINIASKKITELYRWGNEITVYGKYEIDNNNYPLGSWEYVINRYISLINDQEILSSGTSLTELDKKESLAKLNGVLNYHYQTLMQIVNSLQKPDNEKQYLVNLTNNLLLNKINRLQSLLIPYNPFVSYYSIKEIVNNQDWGDYNVYVPLGGFDYKYDQLITLNVNESTYSGMLKESITGVQELFFEKVKISNQQDLVRLNYPKTVFGSINEWAEVTNNEGTYDYVLILPTGKTNNYYLTFKVDFPESVNFLIEENYFDTLSNSLKSIPLIGNSWISFLKENKGSFTYLVYTQNKSPRNQVKANFRLKQKLNQGSLNNLDFQWVPIYNLNLRLEKIENTSEGSIKITPSRQEPQTYLTYIIIAFILLLVVNYIINVLKTDFNHKIISFLDKVKYIFNKISLFIHKIKYLFLTVFLISFLLGIVNGKNASNILYTFAILSLIGLIIGLNIEVRFTLLFSVILLTACAIFRTLKFGNASEWAAIWSYIFLFAAVIQLPFIEPFRKTDDKFIKKIISLWDFYLKRWTSQ